MTESEETRKRLVRQALDMIAIHDSHDLGEYVHFKILAEEWAKAQAQAEGNNTRIVALESSLEAAEELYDSMRAIAATTDRTMTEREFKRVKAAIAAYADRREK